MKPAAFDYHRPSSIAEAVSILREAGGAAKLVAGAQSLGPMLNLRLAQPRILVDIASIPDLARADLEGDELILGACVTAAGIEDGRAGAPPALAMLAAVAGGIAYRAVRNRGTIGGSLCHADPAADWVSVLPALGASCTIAGPAGTRSLPAAAFVRAPFETALEPDEILTAIRIPLPGPRARWGYGKVSRKTGKFAMAIGAVLHDPDRDILRAVIGATDGRPIVIERGSAATLDEARASALLAEAGLRDEAARQLHLVVLRRAAATALAS